MEELTKEQVNDLIAKALDRLKAEREAEETGAEVPEGDLEMKDPTQVSAINPEEASGKATSFPAVHMKPVKDRDAAKKFSICKAVFATYHGNWQNAGLEREMIQEMANNAVYKNLGLVPDTAGGFLVPEEVSTELIDNLRGETVFRRAGSMVIPNAPLTLRIPRKTGNTTAYWVGDSPLTTAVTASDPAFGMMTLQPRRIAARTVLDEDLIAHSAMSAESIVRADVTTTLALAEDLAYYSGTGGSQPLGLVSQPDVTVTNRAVANVDFDWLQDEMAAIRGANGTYNAWVMAPSRWNTLRQLKTGVDTYHHVIDLAAAPRDQLLGLPVFESTQVDAAHIILGNFPNYAIADSGPLAIKVLRELYADQLQIGIVVSHRTDGAPRQPAEFRITNVT